MQSHNMSYLECSEDQHQGEVLNLVCTDKKCSHSRLLCNICEYEKHANHGTLPLKMVLNNAQENEKLSGQGMNLLEVAMYLDRAHLESLKQISHFQEIINNRMSSLNIKVNKYFANLKGQLKNFVDQMVPTSVICDFFKQPSSFLSMKAEKMQEYLNQLLQSFNFDQNGTAVKVQLYQGVMHQCQQKQNELAEKLTDIQKEIDKRTDYLHESFETSKLQQVSLVTITDAPSFTFSPSLKGNNIVLSNQNQMAEQKGSESNGQRFVICEPCIPKAGKIKFSFKVKKYTGWIGVGVCHKEVIQKANFKFNYTNIGHGSYLISNNAYSWSHLQKELNSSHKSFDFSNNDTIHVEVDYVAKKITWQKNDTISKFSMNIDVNQDLYPCANLCSPGDTVEILNKE